MRKRLCYILIASLCFCNMVPIAAKQKTVMKYTKVTLRKGATKKLKLVHAKGRIKWESSSKKIVKVDSKGKITAKGVGAATVWAKNKNKKYKCKVKVVSSVSQYTADRMTVNNSIFTKANYQKLKKMKIGNDPKNIEITKEKDRYAIYSMLAEAHLEPLPKDTEPLLGSWILIFEMKDGTKFEVGLNKYLAYGGMLYSTPDGLVNRVHGVFEKYLK